MRGPPLPEPPMTLRLPTSDDLATLQAGFALMPPVVAMQVRVEDYRDDELVLTAPLAANLNDKGNAFGGSLTSVMTLAAWAWLTLRLRLAGHEADVYVADSQVRYRTPVYGELRALARAHEPGDWRGFLDTFRQRGKARIALQARLVPPGAGEAATLTGRYVAFDRLRMAERARLSGGAAA